MLHLATKMNQLNFTQLMEVYWEGNRENGALLHPELPESQQILNAERSFYQYLTECFFQTPRAVYAIWVENGRYASALRLEPYEDGLLLCALETAPTVRRQGCATALIQAVQEQFPGKLYSHVSKRNLPSLRAHEKCGFRIILDYARYLDGAVARNAVTLCFEKETPSCPA